MFKYAGVEYRRRKINVDSRYRNLFQTPSPNEVSVNIGEDFNDIAVARFTDVQIPATDYNITEYNNKFTLVDDGVEYNIEIPIGDYDTTTLVTWLGTELNSLGATNAYSISTNNNGQLVIQGVGGTLPFQLLFQTGPNSDVINNNANGGTWSITEFNGSSRLIMGFNIEDYTSTGGPIGEIVSPNKINLSGESYVLVKVEAARGGGGNEFDDVFIPDGQGKSVFFKVPLCSPRNAVTFWSNDIDDYKVFGTALKRMRALKFSLLRFDGNPYNTRGVDWSATLVFGTLK